MHNTNCLETDVFALANQYAKERGYDAEIAKAESVKHFV